jgi:hypothetical protein
MRLRRNLAWICVHPSQLFRHRLDVPEYIRVQISEEAWLSACPLCRRVVTIGPERSLSTAETEHQCGAEKRAHEDIVDAA